MFNGTVGVVTAFSTDDQGLTVRTDEDEMVDYDFDELDELAHAWAMTIHRSRGSECPAVVIPITASAWMMLRRNLLYTAITRAKKPVVLVGSRRPLAAAAYRRCRAPPHRPHLPTHRLAAVASAWRRLGAGWPDSARREHIGFLTAYAERRRAPMSGLSNESHFKSRRVCLAHGAQPLVRVRGRTGRF